METSPWDKEQNSAGRASRTLSRKCKSSQSPYARDQVTRARDQQAEPGPAGQSKERKGTAQAMEAGTDILEGVSIVDLPVM